MDRLWIPFKTCVYPILLVEQLWTTSRVIHKIAKTKNRLYNELFSYPQNPCYYYYYY